jgi:hypothetical protein
MNWGDDFDLPDAIRYRWHGVQDTLDPPPPERPRKWTALDYTLIAAAIVIFTAIGVFAAGGPS